MPCIASLASTPRSRRRYAGVAACIITAAISPSLLGAGSESHQRPAADHEDGHDSAATARSTLNVSGRGTVSERPDRAVIALGATSQKPTAAEAQAEVNAALTRAIDGNKSQLSLPQSSMATDSINLQPIYEAIQPRPDGRQQDQPPAIVAYRASNTIRVTVDDLSLVGKVIDIGVKAGCNQVDGVTFQLKDDAAARRSAITAACADARSKAEAIAAALNVDLVGIADVAESGVNIRPPRPPYSSAVARTSALMTDPTPVTPGAVDVSASVTVVYVIRSKP